jgi:hypothetical protein
MICAFGGARGRRRGLGTRLLGSGLPTALAVALGNPFLKPVPGLHRGRIAWRRLVEGALRHRVFRRRPAGQEV